MNGDHGSQNYAGRLKISSKRGGTGAARLVQAGTPLGFRSSEK